MNLKMVKGTDLEWGGSVYANFDIEPTDGVEWVKELEQFRDADFAEAEKKTFGLGKKKYHLRITFENKLFHVKVWLSPREEGGLSFIPINTWSMITDDFEFETDDFDKLEPTIREGRRIMLETKIARAEKFTDGELAMRFNEKKRNMANKTAYLNHVIDSLDNPDADKCAVRMNQDCWIETDFNPNMDDWKESLSVLESFKPPALCEKKGYSRRFIVQYTADMRKWKWGTVKVVSTFGNGCGHSFGHALENYEGTPDAFEYDDVSTEGRISLYTETDDVKNVIPCVEKLLRITAYIKIMQYDRRNDKYCKAVLDSFSVELYSSIKEKMKRNGKWKSTSAF